MLRKSEGTPTIMNFIIISQKDSTIQMKTLSFQTLETILKQKKFIYQKRMSIKYNCRKAYKNKSPKTS